jgi:polygalacturonase
MCATNDTANVPADGLGPVAAAVEMRPEPLLADVSGTHRVRVLGRRVLVERYAGVSYARFAMGSSGLVEVEVTSPIRTHTIFPAERVASSRVAGTVLTFDLPAPMSVVLWIDQLVPLFLLSDPLEDDAPVHGMPDVLDVTDFGADPSGRSLATTALQAAIDHAAGLSGGGTVLLPRDVYRSGTLALRSNVSLYLAPGALLQGSADPSDYPIDPGREESAGDASLPPDVRYHGRTMTFSRLLLVDHATNVRIGGRGTIDGAGRVLRTQHGIAPNLLRVRESTQVTVRDVLFRNAAAWSLHVLASSGVAFENVKVINDRTMLNTDGIDVDMSSDVTIDRSFIYTKDDAICVKATRNSDLSGDPARILATNNLVSARDAALKLGSESEAASFSDIRFERNYVFDSGRAMSVVVRDGATCERVTYRAIQVGPHVDHLIEQVIGVRDPAVALGVIRDLTFDDVSAPSFARPVSNWTWYAQFRPNRPGPGTAVPVFEGADEAHPVEGLTLRNVVVNGQHLHDAATARRVANLSFGPYVRDVTFE